MPPSSLPYLLTVESTMRMRSVIWMVGVFGLSYSTLTVMVTTLSGTVPDYNKETSISLTKQRERSFYKHQSAQMQEIVAEEDITQWQHVRDEFDLHQLTPTNGTTHYIETRNLCGLAQAFSRYQDSILFRSSPHVLWWRNPTDSNDPALVWQENGGCSISDLWQYFNHEDTLAVFVARNTTGVKLLAHPKVFPMTAGLWQDKSSAQQQELWEEITEKLPHTRKHNRTLPVLIVGDRAETTRTAEVKDRLEHSFGASKIKTVYHPRDGDHALLYENFLKAQFVVGVMLTADGDHHDWVAEALALGAIPVLEEDNHHNNNAIKQTKNGYHRSLLDELPVVWIDDYDSLEPDTLQMEYAAVLHDVADFQYERLTQRYWIDKALTALEEREAERIRDAEEFARLRAKTRKDSHY